MSSHMLIINDNEEQVKLVIDFKPLGKLFFVKYLENVYFSVFVAICEGSDCRERLLLAGAH